ncbi:PREDICTED: uncharacterized protein LOC109181338 [Ipomoea nil]|uniref:uncharacterized protein LOC109181338 n=1 Tax=Ipomoea nil TaxID=35883 RepID=UPI000900EEE2|nr:PREDICTED: uncharacterized protein LOC109181338 [Ipomoea nil]
MTKKKRVHFLLALVAIYGLSTAAEKCREMVGKEAASKSGQFGIMDCLDGGTGTVACMVKEGVKSYIYSIKTTHAEIASHLAKEGALAEAVSQGMTAKDATKEAQKAAAKATKVASRQAEHILGPIVSSGWDLFETFYFRGSITEGLVRSSGTLVGTYLVGFLGEKSYRRVGYFVGSMLGSWVGGKVGVMIYDLVNGVQYILQKPQQQPYQRPAGHDEF